MGKTKVKPAATSLATSSGADSTSASTGGGLSNADTTRVEYYDPGTHWCKPCNFVAFKLHGYLEHLQSSSHMKVGTSEV